MRTVVRSWLAAATVLLLLFTSSGLRGQGSETVLFGFTNSWRYNQTVSYDGINWTAPAFNDSALPIGRGVLGFEDSGNTFVTARTNTALTIGRTTYYFRTHFTFTNSTPGLTLTFSNIIDDGAVFYLNGVEIQRLYMTNNAPVLYSSLSTNHEATGFDVFTLSGPALTTNLVNGDNVLAVEVHQTTAGSSDIAFGCALSANMMMTPPPLRLPLTLPTYGYTTVNAFPGLGFGQPVGFASPPGETNRLFVLSKGGQMYVITNLASPTRTTFMDLSGRVYTGSESGLIGLAFHPGYATNRFFYIFYSASTNGGGSGLFQRVSRFQTSAVNPNQAPTNSELMLLNQKDPAGNHNGGDLQFGPDGYLYISLGDGGVQYDGDRHSQIISSNYFSAIMRIDVDKRPGNLLPNPHIANSTNYWVPADNPYIGLTSFDGRTINPTNIRTEFWAVGFRNPWRMSFDPVTGFLYCGDVGQDRWEEVSVITKGGNYGWAYLEGTHTGYRATNTVVGPLIPPIQEYAHGTGSDQGNSVTGGVVYRGNRLPQLYGWYVFADYVSDNVWILHYDGTNTVPFQRITTRADIAAFGTDPSNGDVLMGSLADGAVYRLVYNTNITTGVPLPPTLADTGAFTNLASITNRTQPLTASSGLVPYDINVHFWSDGADKSRWFLGSPDLKIGFAPEGNWTLPTGMAWVKHFDLEMTNGVPESARRLETRFLVKNANGVYGVTYRWGNSLTNAALVPDEGMDEVFTINDGGILRTQVWHYPSRSECLACHTPFGGWALGFNTPQMSGFFHNNGYDDQVAAMSAAGYFTTPVTNTHSLRALAAATNESSSLEWRVRSYLSANCVQCHQPGGPALGFWNASVSNSTANSGLIDGALVNNSGNPDARVIAPGSLTNSMLLSRISRRGPGQMPPLATSEIDTQAVQLVSAWITNDLAAGWTNTSAPLIVGAAAINGGVAVQFVHPANRAYQVETATSLSAPIVWQFLNVPANRPVYPSVSYSATVMDTNIAPGQKFYRVRLSAP
ncbi:MAG TPA: PQQ-dependent sugar dehydrogenase [Methylomirabilota bacterium]|nr:PQQ-dependent sugar dehydrogenase [Methylomirabilota bacterium]